MSADVDFDFVALLAQRIRVESEAIASLLADQSMKKHVSKYGQNANGSSLSLCSLKPPREKIPVENPSSSQSVDDSSGQTDASLELEQSNRAVRSDHKTSESWWHDHIATVLSPPKRGAQRKRILEQMEYGASFRLDFEHLRLHRFVKSPHFEVMSILLILLNTFFTALEAQYASFDAGRLLEFPGFTLSGPEIWPGVTEFFHAADVTLQISFIIELFMRIGGMRWAAVWSVWIWFDTALVVLGLVHLTTSDADDVDPTILRLARMARLARLLTVVRSIRQFDSLYLLIRSIQASFGALVWSFSFLFAIQITIGLIMCQSFASFYSREDVSIEVRRECFGYFGSFSRMLITMFEVSIGNWVPACRFLMDNVSEWFALFFLLYVCMWCFAVLRVITAVFITETNHACAQDLDIAIRRRNRERMLDMESLRELFNELDIDSNGGLTYEELQALITDPVLNAWLRTVNLHADDLNELHSLLADSKGNIRVKEFVDGIIKFRGVSKEIHMVALAELSRKIDAKVEACLARTAANELLLTQVSGAVSKNATRDAPDVATDSSATFKRLPPASVQPVERIVEASSLGDIQVQMPAQTSREKYLI
eukprot:TRINITY_DN28582_c0_g1_i1.p1 TRINITY_DN28582_c0_g1~~TRINITY_DN28582_c0_g1_i1.p1  ORF type:complete len:598 (+),score=78.50 TRINITY_DN28582_c0_g1_i1:61-1854(+)